MTHIYPFNEPCPKCGRIVQAKRYEPEVTEEQYEHNRKVFKENFYDTLYPDLPKTPHQEHLVHECQCGHIFWTRTRDYAQCLTDPEAVCDCETRVRYVHKGEVVLLCEAFRNGVAK